MARALKFILILAIIGVAFCAPTEDVTVTESAAAGTEHGAHAKGKSVSDWVKKPIKWSFDVAHKGVDMGMNITKKALDFSEDISEKAVEFGLKPLDWMGHKIAEKWQKVHLKGSPADVSKYPFVAFIVKGEKDTEALCGGTIVHQRFVLTAAHCLDNLKEDDKLYVSVGSDSVTGSNRQIVAVEEIINRPSYNPKKLTFDGAILKLAKDLKFSKEVSAITLPEKSDYDAEHINEGKAVALGTCEKTHKMIEKTVEILSLEECSKSFELYYNQLCVKNEQGSCNAQSGYPLTQKVDGKDILVGWASYTGEPCEASPAVYSRMSKWMTWVKKVIENDKTN
ncbi:mast cell protease 1A-like [Chrysoperla carnea]|uniref:mast cell protease 1A-like n=1 Tax=Chrysoperla carnea TaxID=189513 RepID=UPI001D06D251|nr:mast cell protease 1A-like [Chrysoperla carnea]